MLEINKRLEELAKYQKEIESLEKKKDSIIKRYNSKIDTINNEIEEVKEYIKKLENLRWFKREDIIPVICYLISSIENKKYYYVERELPVLWDYRFLGTKDSKSYDNIKLLKLVYICSNKKEAKNYLDNKIEELEKSSSLDHKEMLEKLLLEPKKEYVQINFYSPYMDRTRMYFINNINNGKELYSESCSITYQETSTNYKRLYTGSTSHIRKEEYLYIIDFIEYLINKKIENEKNDLTIDEMFGYADDFVNVYKEENNIITRKRKK